MAQADLQSTTRRAFLRSPETHLAADAVILPTRRACAGCSGRFSP